MIAWSGPTDDRQQRMLVGQRWWLGYILVVCCGLLVTAVARRQIGEPFVGLSLGLVLLLLLGWLLQPRATLYATLTLTAISDIVTVSWFPFVKNFSSRESIAFVADAVTISPVDMTLGIGVAISMLRHYAHTGRPVRKHPLLRPMLVFTAMVAFGFFRGVSRGGDLRLAVLEGRPLFYIALTFVIVVNECTERAHARRALVAILVGVVIQALLSINYLTGLSASTRDSLESLNEHGSALAQNLFIITWLGFWTFRVKGPLMKWGLIAGLGPVIYIFFVAQRRAGVAALIVAAVLIAISLFWQRRRAFWVVVPIATILLTGYVGAFWNSTSSLAFPAQAVKTIIAPNSASEEDRSSDLYRVIEAYDLNFTIRTEPALGLGFGQPFYRPIPLPEISFFELNAYQAHNSVLWFWVKTGFVGFASMFYLIGRSLQLGAERMRRETLGPDLIVALGAVTFVAMFAVYTYVDISWDARNTVFLGLAAAICGYRTPSAEPDGVDDAQSAAGTERTSDEMTAAIPSA